MNFNQILLTFAMSIMALAGINLSKASGGVFPLPLDPMVTGVNVYSVSDPLLTIGETIPGTSGELNSTTAGDYTPVGVLDGIGAYKLDRNIIRIFTNHELGNSVGNEYFVTDGPGNSGNSFSLVGARISYFDIHKETRQIVDGGIAYSTIYDANGQIAEDTTFLANNFPGFGRFCSGGLFEANTFRKGNSRKIRGLENTIYFAGEEDGGSFNPVGGAEWALDVENGDMWHLPALGRGAWENITLLDTGNTNEVAILLTDDTSPFDADGDGIREASPLYLYIGEKDPNGDFPARNGLRGGKLYVWVSRTGERTPTNFNGSGSLQGDWVEIDNSQNLALADEFGANGFDEFGYPTQRNLWTQAEALGAFGFSRPEDVATNPRNGSEAVFASTGVDTYENGVDTFGTIYTITTNFNNLRSRLTIIYDGDADPARALRSPDNVDWADNGFIYVQEDKAENQTLDGEALFGVGAVNPNEAGIVRLNPKNGSTLRVANINRSVVLDGSIANPEDAVDRLANDAGEWETSGILDVSKLFDEDRGTLLLFDVQAHGIQRQDAFNFDSRINNADLFEGGQLLFLELNNDRGGKDDDDQRKNKK
ncbi:MAG: alkaline phosphatase PhoX [Thermodesulfobacteriota bacterium]